MLLKNLDGKLCDLKGEPLKSNDKDITLRMAICDALTSDDIKENIPGKQKFSDWELAQRIQNAEKQIELETEEIARIKELIGYFCKKIIVGPAFMYLEGKCPKNS